MHSAHGLKEQVIFLFDASLLFYNFSLFVNAFHFEVPQLLSFVTNTQICPEVYDNPIIYHLTEFHLEAVLL